VTLPESLLASRRARGSFRGFPQSAHGSPDDEKAARILGVTVGSARLAKRRLLGAAATGHRQPRARVADPRRQKLQLDRRRNAADPVRDFFGILLDAPTGSVAWWTCAKNGLNGFMMGVEAVDGICVKATKGGSILLECVLGLARCSLQKRIDK
jgi:hypothetical protein